jgi:putative peptidoglycan lipid II flippase
VAVVPFTGYMILLRGFFAVQDARTPALITTGVSIVGVGGCLAAAHLLPPRLVVVGIPIAYALAYTVGLLAAAVALRHRLGRIDGRRLARTYGRVALATIAAASVAAGVAGLQTRLTGTGWTGALLSLITAGLLGAATYLLAGRLLHLTEVRQVLATVGIRAPARGPE